MEWIYLLGKKKTEVPLTLIYPPILKMLSAENNNLESITFMKVKIIRIKTSHISLQRGISNRY